MKRRTRSEMLEKDRIGRLLVKLSLPAAVSMLAHAVYNTVDTIFVGQWVGTLGIGAIAVVLPIFMLIMAVTQIVGIGGASVLSRRMGAGNTQGMGLTLGNMMLLTVLLGVVIQLMGLFWLTPLLRLFGATEALLPLSRQYFQIILLSGPLMTFSMSINDAVRAEGNARMAMLTVVAGALLNIVLDPIFIYVLKMGVRGAAVATVISMGLSSGVLLLYFVSGMSEIPVGLRYLRLSGHVIKEMMSVGSSAFVRMGAMSFMVALLNHTLSRYGGDMGIATFGVVFRMLSFIFMPIMGLSMGLQPVVGFNYGAGLFPRVRQSIKWALIASVILATAGFLVVLLFPEAIMKVFTKDPGLVTSGSNALRLCMFFLPLAGCQVVGAAFFQALGKAVPALLLSLSRQVLALIPLIVLLPRFYGLNGIWLSFPVADVVTFIVTMALVMGELRKMPKTLPVP
ncbi:MATE efflux family protein [delta proteobacterium NaphS2]|nr:MATE efflux family protein [delta proteobacterium NaphS2]